MNCWSEYGVGTAEDNSRIDSPGRHFFELRVGAGALHEFLAVLADVAVGGGSHDRKLLFLGAFGHHTHEVKCLVGARQRVDQNARAGCGRHRARR